MTTLAADTPRSYQLGDIEEYPVIAADIIYEGACVGEDGNGYARPMASNGTDVFLGFAEQRADNSDGSAGDVRVRVRTRGRVQLTVTGAAITGNDRPAVYALDDNSFTIDGGSPQASLIGWVSRFVETNVAIVEFDAGLVRAALHA